MDLGPQLKKNKIIEVDCDMMGQPTHAFWRKRVVDSERDNCVEFVEERRKKKEVDSKKDNKKSAEEIDIQGDK